MSQINKTTALVALFCFGALFAIVTGVLLAAAVQPKYARLGGWIGIIVWSALWVGSWIRGSINRL